MKAMPCLDINIYIEYLDKLSQINLTLKLIKCYLIDDISFEEDNIHVTLSNKNESNGSLYSFRIDFIDFKLVKSSNKQFAINHPCPDDTSNESLFNFKVTLLNEKFDLGIDHHIVRSNEINEITNMACYKCKSSLISKTNEKFQVLPLPDHELDELADNFFCHLHDHNHNNPDHNSNNSHEETDMTNILNPLRSTAKLRRSILSSFTTLVLNANHLDSSSITFNTDSVPLIKLIKCKNCAYEIGFKGKKENDYFIWKSNIIINESIFNDNLLIHLTKGRYLIENKQKSNQSLFVWILGEHSYFKHIKYISSTNTDNYNALNKFKICLSDLSKLDIRKIFYKYSTSSAPSKLERKQTTEVNVKAYRNDFNVTCLDVSDQQFNLTWNNLNSSTLELSPSMQTSQDFLIAFV